MTVTELMSGKTPDSNYEGWVSGDDFVLALDCGATPATAVTAQTAGGFQVVELGVSALDAKLNPITQDKTYIRAGQSTFKTGNQRSFTVTADRYEGDGFQDFALSHARKFGKGADVTRKYIYFNILTGKGESGDAALIVNSDGSGAAGESAKVEIELKKSGAEPSEYAYTAAG